MEDKRGRNLLILAHELLFLNPADSLYQEPDMADDLKMVNYLEAGYRSEVEKQKTIAQNMANMFTPGYRRFDIRFEEILQKAIDQKQKAGVKDLTSEAYRPETSAVNFYGNDVSLDSEVGELVKNSLKHKAFMMMLNKKYKQFENAMNVSK